VSIAAIFIAGVLPGILVGLGLMVVAGILSARHNYGKGERFSISQNLKAFINADPSLHPLVVYMAAIGAWGF
jgi:TRAP-type C4-dicarboxylate transport system permease large subunit